MTTHLYGWKRDVPSPKDWLTGKLLTAALIPPETAAIAAARASGVLAQARQDCVADGLAKAIEVTTRQLPSRNWIYYMAGCLEGSQKLDNGRYIRDAFDALAKVGWPTETVWPYDGNWNVHPGAIVHRMAYDAAMAFAPAYYRIDQLGPDRVLHIKQAIASGYPVVVGSDVTQAWEDQDGKTPLPYADATPLGGHCYGIYEYDPGGMHILNSWGVQWGNDGWGYLGWDWADQFGDVWVLTLRST